MKSFLANRSHFMSVKGKVLALVIIFLFISFWYSLPNPLFDTPTSIVLESNDGQLLGARIANDGQWRFPYSEEIPTKFEKSILAFEDKRFYSHWGVDFRALCRAFIQNIRSKGIVSGGSTISMQVIRLSRSGKPRTVFQKLIEIVLSLRLELSYSKKQILGLYASYAPFGGNVVGLEAASWRYFGKVPASLSWGETATLSVLPNSPSMIHLGKNRDALRRKRNRLLKKLYDNSVIDSINYHLAIEEPLPERPLPLPQLCPHFLQWLATKKMERDRIISTIDIGLQRKVNEIAEQHHNQLANNEIHNLAILVINSKSKQVVAYTGNAPNAGMFHSQSVDIIQSARSTGSLLKPLLYAMMLQEGYILPESLVPDVPLYLKNFRPENFMNTYDGVIPANKALSRSLNIPFVVLLQRYGVEKFHFNLRKFGISTLYKAPEHYGLSLILGGSEATLWDLTNIYASMAYRLNNYYTQNGLYDEQDFEQADMYLTQENLLIEEKRYSKNTGYISADAIWLAFDAMRKLERPNSQGEWERFQATQKIAWKTGTSYGFRDAWAIGVNADYTVGVWAGNADGEGRPNLTGVGSAAPIMFDVFEQLPISRWFDQPFDNMKKIAVCSLSRCLPLEICPKDSMWVQENAMLSNACTYHQMISLDFYEKWQVTRNCYPLDAIKDSSWFVLSPIEGYYYKPKHPNYESPPPMSNNCIQIDEGFNGNIQLIYPPANAKVVLPTDFNGNQERTVFKATHRNHSETLFWHIDNTYIGSTHEIHEFQVSPNVGKHIIVLVDSKGNRIEREFEILSK